jgi:hypothetical protein
MKYLLLLLVAALGAIGALVGARFLREPVRSPAP